MMWMLPADLDRDRDAKIHLCWYRRAGAVNTGSTVSRDVDVLAWKFEQDIDSTLDLALTIVDGVMAGLGEERGDTLELPHSVLFGQDIRALKPKVRRVASTSDVPDTAASAPILHFFGIEYPLRDYHTREAPG